jgi:hypothetical protein
MAINKFTKWI